MNIKKSMFLLSRDLVYLNHGSFGACPKPIFKDYQKWQLELESSPVNFMIEKGPILLKASRLKLANYIGTYVNDIVYTTNPVVKKADDLTEKIINENTYVVFTSPSTFNSFIDKYNLKNKIISIGDTTTDHIRERGFEPLMTAKMQSYEGISNSIIDYLNKKLNHELS